VATGDFLADHNITDSMVQAYAGPASLNFGDRLMKALDAGVAAGDETNPGISAALLIGNQIRCPWWRPARGLSTEARSDIARVVELPQASSAALHRPRCNGWSTRPWTSGPSPTQLRTVPTRHGILHDPEENSDEDAHAPATARADGRTDRLQ
jgi:hypothetical protein